MFLIKNTVVIHNDEKIPELIQNLSKFARFKSNLEPEENAFVVIVSIDYDSKSLEEIIIKSKYTFVLENRLEYLDTLINIDKKYKYKFQYILDTTRSYYDLLKENLK